MQNMLIQNIDSGSRKRGYKRRDLEGKVSPKGDGHGFMAVTGGYHGIWTV